MIIKIKVQSVTDTDNEFTECQNTKEKAPINWHFTCQLTHIYEKFKERYFHNFIFYVKGVGAQNIQTSHQEDLKKTKHVKQITSIHKI